MSQSLVSQIPTQQEVQVLRDLGTTLVKSGFLPTSIKTPEQAIAIMLKGKELGIPPMQAFSSIAIISGKPTISAELMLALIYRNVPGAVVDFIEITAKVCVISAKRPGGKLSTFSFSIEEAKNAGLLNKENWTKYPSAMLRARCISAMARAMFPDALMGASYVHEEMGADVTADGEIIDIEPEVAPDPEKKQTTGSHSATTAVGSDTSNSSTATQGSVASSAKVSTPNEWKPTEEHARALSDIVKLSSCPWNADQVKVYMGDKFGKSKLSELKRGEYDLLIAAVRYVKPEDAFAEIKSSVK